MKAPGTCRDWLLGWRVSLRTGDRIHASKCRQVDDVPPPPREKKIHTFADEMRVVAKKSRVTYNNGVTRHGGLKDMVMISERPAVHLICQGFSPLKCPSTPGLGRRPASVLWPTDPRLCVHAQAPRSRSTTEPCRPWRTASWRRTPVAIVQLPTPLSVPSG
jgi:hypothetical protein